MLDVAADHKRDCTAEGAALPIHVQAGQVVWIEAQLHPAAHQRWIHRVALAGEGDRGGAAHPAQDRRSEGLPQQGGFHLTSRPPEEEAHQRHLARLGVLPEIAHLLGPGQEAVVQFLETGDALGFRLEEEALADVAVQALLLATPLGGVGAAMDQADAEHRARAREGSIGVGRAVVHIEPLREAAALDSRPQHLLSSAGSLLREPPRMDQQAGVVVHQHEEVGALAAGLTRKGYEWPYEDVPDPELIGSIGLEAAVDPSGTCEHRTLEATALQVLANGAFGHPDAMPGLQDGADLGSRASRDLLTQTGRLLQQLRVAAHGPEVGPWLGPESVQALLAVGTYPAVQRGAREDAGVAVRLHMALTG